MRLSLAILILIGTSAFAQTTQIPHYNGEEVGPELVHGSPISAKLAMAPARIEVPGSGSFASDFIMSMVSDSTDEQSIYGVVNDSHANELHIMHSGNGGASWSIASVIDASRFNPYGDSTGLHMAVGAGGNEIFLVTSKGVFISTNHANTFEKFQPAKDEGACDVKLSDDGLRLVVSYMGQTGVETFEKQNGVWVKSPEQPTSLLDFIRSKIPSDTNGFYGVSQVFSVQLDPLVPGVIYAGMGRGVYRYSPKSGWSLIKGVWNDSTIYSIEVDKNSGSLFISSCNGIYAGRVDQSSGVEIPDAKVSLVRTRSNAFVNQSIGKVSPTYLRTFDVEERKGHPSDRVAGSASGVYISRDSGATWTRVTGGDLKDKENSTYVDFRSVLWLADGTVLASGVNGTYRFTP